MASLAHSLLRSSCGHTAATVPFLSVLPRSSAHLAGGRQRGSSCYPSSSSRRATTNITAVTSSPRLTHDAPTLVRLNSSSSSSASPSSPSSSPSSPSSSPSSPSSSPSSLPTMYSAMLTKPQRLHMDHIQNLFDHHIASLSNTLTHPTALLDAIRTALPLLTFPQPGISALKLLNGLLDRYVDISQRAKGWESDEAPKVREILVEAAKGVDESWKGVFGRTEIEEGHEQRRVWDQMLYPRLVGIWTEGGDWEAVRRVALEVGEKGAEEVELEEKLVEAAYAYLDFVDRSILDPVYSATLLTHLLLPSQSVDKERRSKALTRLFNHFDQSRRSRDDDSRRSEAEAVRVLLDAVKRDPSLASAGLLNKFLNFPDHTRLMDEVWELAQVDSETLLPVASSYIQALLSSKRASEVPQVTQLLLDRKALHSDSNIWPHLLEITAVKFKDWVGAARLVLDLIRVHGSEQDVLRSIAKFEELADRPAARSAGPKIKEARGLLESELGVEVWEKAKTVKKLTKGGSS